MIKVIHTNPIPLYYIMEAAVNPGDIKTVILRENDAPTADGGKIKTVTAKSVLQSFEVINWNGRLYPTNVVMPSLDNNQKIQNDIKRKQWGGEFGHPDSDKMVRMAQVLPEFTSHYIDRYWRERNLLMGEVTTAPYGRGLWMYNIIMSGRPWGFSLRAFGGVDSNNVAILPMTIITYDEVNRPSHKESYATKEDIAKVAAYSDTILKEAAGTTIIESSTVTQQLTSFILDKSDNIAMARELFGLTEVSKANIANGGIILEGSYMGNTIQVSVPIENYIRNNYLDILSINKYQQ